MPSDAIRSPRPPPTGLTRLALIAAGADSALLGQCPRTEQLRLFALGWLVLVICAANGAALSVASWLTLQPAQAGLNVSSAIVAAESIGFGAAWALIVLNLFRFMVSSTGRGAARAEGPIAQASRLLTLQVGFKIFFCVLIAACASLPVTVLIVRDDIQGRLSEQQQSAVDQFQRSIRSVADFKLAKGYEALADDHLSLQAAHSRLKTLQKLVDATGAQAPRRAGDAAQAAELTKEITAVKQTIADATAAFEGKRQALQASIDATEQELQAARDLITGSNALWAEVSRALFHARPVLAIVAVFMLLLHLSPVLWQSLTPPGPYDRRVALQNELVCAKRGIARGLKVRDRDGTEITFDRYLAAEKIARRQVDAELKLRADIRRAIHEKGQMIRGRILGERA